LYLQFEKYIWTTMKHYISTKKDSVYSVDPNDRNQTNVANNYASGIQIFIMQYLKISNNSFFKH